jgi:hypothetical protein
MGLINWIFDFYQEHRADQLRQDLDRARAEVAAVRTSGGGVDALRLEHALGELALAVKTLQRVMVEKGVCSAQEFQQKLMAVDREDGVADGRAPVR